VEVLVAIVVAAVVSAAAYGLVGSIAQARRASMRAEARALPAAGARQALEDWLRAAAVFDGSGFTGADRFADGVPRDEVAFAVEDGGALRPGPRRIRLWVSRSYSGPAGLLAEVAQMGPRAEPPETLVVTPDAGGLQVAYRTTVNDHVRWVDTWASDSLLPEAVDLRILPAAEDAARGAADGLAPLLRLPLRVRLRTETLDPERTRAPRP
jgi:hypothetical protein